MNSKKFLMKLYQFAVNDEVVINGVVFRRGRYLPDCGKYILIGEKFNLMLDKNTLVEPLKYSDNVESC